MRGRPAHDVSGRAWGVHCAVSPFLHSGAPHRHGMGKTGKRLREKKSMSRFAFIVAAALAVSPVSARAQEKMVVDMGKLTCSQLTKLGFQDFAGVTMWLSGYYNSSVGNTVVDLATYARASTKVKEFCQKNGRATVMAAAERVLGIKMPR